MIAKRPKKAKPFLADLHIHSRFSMACARNIDPESLAWWAACKGIAVVGTGDCQHPGWLAELEDRLVPDGLGLFKLAPARNEQVLDSLPGACRAPVRFMLTTEISTIYKQDGKTRKVHHVICLPSFDAVHVLQEKLDAVGNIRSDGRPILGLQSEALLAMVLEASDEAFLIPAHIWTPWFSVLGAKSGFDSIADCYGALAPEIFAVETGLSSDPPMNWRLSGLDQYTLVSNSDAHSPQKLGRECNRFQCERSFQAIRQALKTGQQFLGTVEFFPEEGKYHYDGHRKCGVSLTPEETAAGHGLCPVCGKPVTVGVMHRVSVLADRPIGAKPEQAKPFVRLLGLKTVLSQVLGVGPATKKVQRIYDALIEELGPELPMLMDAPEEQLCTSADADVACAINLMRRGEIHIQPGFDGQFGEVTLNPTRVSS